MTKSKKIFIGICFLFFCGVAYMSYDISSKTTFPSFKSQLKERLKKQYLKPDSSYKDTVRATHR